MNGTDYGLKEMNEIDYGLRKIKMKPIIKRLYLSVNI